MARRPRAEYDIHANDKSEAGWNSAIRRADANGRKLKSTIGSAFAGVIGVQTFTSQIAKAIEFGDEIGKLKVKFGATAEATQELVAVARMFDVEIGSLTTSLRKMQVAVSQASTGNKEILATFDALGLDFRELKRLKPDEQFVAIGDAISRLRDEEDRARAETVLFGRSGGELRPMFENGAEGIRKARMEVHEFGQVLSDMDIKKLQEADDAIKKISATWDGFWRAAAVGVVSYGQTVDTVLSKSRELLTQQSAIASAARIVGSSIPFIGPLLLAAEVEARAASRFPQTERFPAEAGLGGRGRPPPAPRGFAADVTEGVPQTKKELLALAAQIREDLAKDPFDREQMALGQSLRAVQGFVQEGSLELFADQTKAVEDALADLPEPILELSDSLIQADELQKEFTRSMFQNVSELLFSLSDGADNFADSMLTAFKRILADRATLELFNMLSGLGSSLTGSSGGKGFAGFIGAGLTSLFGGFKADGGPLNPGKWYIAGERGPEPVWGGGAGAFAMGYGGGRGAPQVNIPITIDARGATPDFIKAMPEVLNRAKAAWKSELVRELKAGKYG